MFDTQWSTARAPIINRSARGVARFQSWMVRLLIAHTVQSGGRCQPHSMCPDFTDLTQSGWTAALGFNSPSLCFGSLNRNRATPRALLLMMGAQAVLH